MIKTHQHNQIKPTLYISNHVIYIVSWTAFITIFAEHDPEESFLMFSKLCQEGFSPDRHTYSIVLKACAGLVTDRHTLAIHSQILKYGFENDTVLANANSCVWKIWFSS